MKLSLEERTALKTGKSKFKTLLLFVLLSEIIFPQIPFKGFCKLNSFAVDSGFTKIFSLNYDQNEHSDILIYNPQQKVAELFDGKSGLKFILKNKITLPTEISSIEPIIYANNMIESFAFTSRKSRNFGIYKFNTSGNVSLVSKIKFNSYPENISIAKNYTNGEQSFLISGNSFDGLSIISLKNNQLIEKKAAINSIFQNAQFIDVNSDGFEDIAAISTIENKLLIFYNNSRDDFKELKQINVNDDVLSLRVFDINYDHYTDIIVSTKSGIKIYFGDALASFDKTIFIETSYPVDKFIIGDFNRDGFFDFNCLSIEEGIISTIFAKDFNLFYSEFLQKQKKGIVDLIPFFSKFVYGSAFLNELGEISILSKVNSMSDDQQLAVGINPDIIKSFDHINNGIADFAFTDEFDKKLKFILRNSAGIPERLFSVDLYDDHEKMFVFDNSNSRKTFFLYSNEKKIIESLEIDFEKFTFSRRFHYAEGPIKDLIIKPDSKGDAELFILYSTNRLLNLQVITKTEINYNKKLYNDLSSNWEFPFLFFADNLTIGYWQNANNLIKLIFLDFSSKDRKFLNKLKFNSNIQLIASNSNHSLEKGKFKYCSLLSDKDEIFLVAGSNEPKIYSAKNSNNEFRITDKNQLFFGKTNSVFIYNSKLKALTEFATSNTDDRILITDKFKNIELTNYTIQKLDQRNYHLIFTDINSGNIEIRQLSR
ncbi:MAG: VCBS repeat-containing protein [Ignavibacterium sp.]|nr:VCBS repeat-containing protein [Ignavibacterium sp.]